MVFIWSSGWGPRRRRRPRHGGGYRGHYAGHYRSRYGPHPGYGHGYGRRPGGDSCLRDLLFLNTGCCLANAIGCGMDSLLLAPATARQVVRSRAGETGTGAAGRLVAAVRVYQREISPRRPPSCRYTPTCSAYAVAALERHGARRGAWLTVRRLVRCRPGAGGGLDPVPAAAWRAGLSPCP